MKRMGFCPTCQKEKPVNYENNLISHKSWRSLNKEECHGTGKPAFNPYIVIRAVSTIKRDLKAWIEEAKHYRLMVQLHEKDVFNTFDRRAEYGNSRKQVLRLRKELINVRKILKSGLTNLEEGV